MTITSKLSNSAIELISNLPEVIKAKEQIDTQLSGSVYFNIEVTDSIKNHLEINLSEITSIPMRWIKGDTKPHIDKGTKSFDSTYLAYLTDSPGELIVDGEPYPIHKGCGYAFSEGLRHETVGTGAEPRLLLGPMSETGFSVGVPVSSIQMPGGSSIYIRQGISDVEYSTDESTWYQVIWPCQITNTDTANGLLQVNFQTNIILPSISHYFQCMSSHIQFGSSSLKLDGSRPIITIDDVGAYIGLIQNGTDSSDGFDSIHVYNLLINTANGSTLVDSNGWIGSRYFGKGTSSSYIINCSSSGPIAQNGGGIIGANAGPINLIGCSSSGAIAQDGGGIIGSDSPSSGVLRCEMCWTTGIIGTFGGGITGSATGAATILNCYSEGAITENAGGISGRYTGASNYSVVGCYSRGAISNLAGGIIGSDAGVVSIRNCYSTGAIATGAGGIIGTIPAENSTAKQIQACYTTGISSLENGYIIAGMEDTGAATVTTLTIGSGEVTLTNNRHQDNWTNGSANDALEGIPSSIIGTTWVNVGVNQPYEIIGMGYSPYTRIIVTGTTPSIVKTRTASVVKGSSTSPAIVSGKSYTILKKLNGDSGSYNTITINSTSGVISTTSATAVGEYTLYIRNTGSYNITTYVLTVTEPPPVSVQLGPTYTNNAMVFYKSGSLASGGVCTVRNSRAKSRRV